MTDCNGDGGDGTFTSFGDAAWLVRDDLADLLQVMIDDTSSDPESQTAVLGVIHGLNREDGSESWGAVACDSYWWVVRCSENCRAVTL